MKNQKKHDRPSLYVPLVNEFPPTGEAGPDTPKHLKIVNAIDKLKKTQSILEDLILQIKGDTGKLRPCPSEDLITSPSLAVILASTPNEVLNINETLSKQIEELRSLLF